jgi:small nuclear ribonucleoprotein
MRLQMLGAGCGTWKTRSKAADRRLLLVWVLPLDSLSENLTPNSSIKKPLVLLQKAISKPVRVRLKNSEEYRGVMVNIDPYMNVFLSDAAEFDDGGSMVTNYGKVVIRGNNVLFVMVEEALKM